MGSMYGHGHGAPGDDGEAFDWRRSLIACEGPRRRRPLINPHGRAVVTSVDGKTQIQALGRTQAPLPIKSGHRETRTHDDRRSGTTCLMAALDVATGTVTCQMVARHRPEEFLAFLEHVSEGTEPGTRRFTSFSTTSPLSQVGRGQPMAEGQRQLDVPPRLRPRG